jgi:hypothetical protein
MRLLQEMLGMKRFVLFAMTLVCFAFSSPLHADQRSDADKQILGVWQLQFTTPDGTAREPVVVLGKQYDQYVAWSIVNGQPEPFRSVELRDEKLICTIDPSEQPDVTVTLECSLSGDNRCTGTGRYRSKNGGETGEWKLTGKRFNRADFDEYSEWKVSFEIPDNGSQSAVVTVVSRDGKQYAWYQGRDHDLPAREFVLDGDRVEMVVVGELEGGEDVEATFKGVLSGASVTGDVTIKAGGQQGSFPFKGSQSL